MKKSWQPPEHHWDFPSVKARKEKKRKRDEKRVRIQKFKKDLCMLTGHDYPTKPSFFSVLCSMWYRP